MGKDCLVLLVDMSESMFDDPDDEEEGHKSFFETAMRCCAMLMLDKVIASDRSLISIILYGTVRCHADARRRHGVPFLSGDETPWWSLKSQVVMAKQRFSP
jgi:hypothetical protein